MSQALKFIDHVAIAVPAGTLDTMVKLYEMLGFTEIHREEVHGTHMVRESLLRVGESENLLQILEPLSDESPVAKQVANANGRPVLAHVAFRTDDAHAAYSELTELGFKTTQQPGPGSRGTTIFFLHPKSHELGSLGVLYEVVQEGEAH